MDKAIRSNRRLTERSHAKRFVGLGVMALGAIACVAIPSGPQAGALGTSVPTAASRVSRDYCDAVEDLRDLNDSIDKALTSGRGWSYLRPFLIGAMRDARRSYAVLAPQSTGTVRRDIDMIVEYSRRMERLLQRSKTGAAFVSASQRDSLYWPVKEAKTRTSMYTTRVCP